MTGVRAVAQTEKVLHSFNYNGKDGWETYSSLTLDAASNLYGTTVVGGTGSCTIGSSVFGCGTVFELSPRAGGGWTEKVLYNFHDDGEDGNYPYAGLIFDTAGNLYGTTQQGGATYGSGTVFVLSPKTDGGWSEKIIFSFTPDPDGAWPEAALIFDSRGNLYGTASTSGYGYGTVFELSPGRGRGWTETTLHTFNNDGMAGDGEDPVAGVILDTAGNLYGTTELGGPDIYGTVFELTPGAVGWAETLPHSFGEKGGSGYDPQGGLILDADGNLYGTTTFGGIYGTTQGGGIAFELTPKAGGVWAGKVLHNFGNSADGSQPHGSLIFDRAGNLYGTTALGGTYNCGTVFKLTPKTGGGWAEEILHNFHDSDKDGCSPASSLTFDSAGNLYGTTVGGGMYGYGTVFEVTP